jgi:hypothetical protein
MKTPYDNQPDTAFWRRSVADVPPGRLDPVVKSRFQLDSTTRVATAGSCFAQHISRNLSILGINPLVTESAHELTGHWAGDFQYGLYSARYGNVYSARQMRQLFERAFGLRVTLEDYWLRPDGTWADPYRPALPGGFVSRGEAERDRERHLSAVRRMFEQLDVLIFTLGLTEVWESCVDGSVLPVVPGAVAGEFVVGKYRFVNLGLKEVVEDLMALLGLMKSVNASAKILLTVSPVPLVATATGEHVLVATTYSKSVLRVAAHEVVAASTDADYFPSYELITGLHMGNSAFEPDLRSVRQVAVEYVMQVFNRHYTHGVEGTRTPIEATDYDSIGETRRALELICEEEANDAQGR